MSSIQRRRVEDASTLGPFDADLPDDPRLTEAVKEYLRQMEAGQAPSRQELLRRYPDLAAPLAQCLDGLELVHKAARGDQPSARPETNSVVDPALASPLGDFRIVREIARGGMGVVYEATQLSLGRRVALKVLPFAATFDAKHLQRFHNEAQAAALLHHTNIVPVYAVGCERGVHFYAMQLIDGQTLAELIQQLRRRSAKARATPAAGEKTAIRDMDLAGMMPEPSAEETPLGAALTTQRSKSNADYFRMVARMILQAAEGLEHAHQYGIIHRDIKPANLLVDAQGRLWITDFGLAQMHADAGLTRTGDVLGTLRYMSPEQASGQRVVLDHRTDIYSLGATFYELATLEPIFVGQNQHELLRQILNEEPRLPRAVDKDVPIELETIILKAVSKNPADRYASARELADDVQRYLDDKPIQAKRPGVIERVRKWSRRHPSFVGAAALVLLLGTIGLGISTALVTRSLEREKISTALVTQSLEREKKRAEEADLRFRLARRSADEMIQLAEVELADNPAMQNLRRQLLEMALVYFQELIELRRDEPEAQVDLAVTRDQVKKILNDLAVLQGAGHLFLLKHGSVLDDLDLHGDERDHVNQFVQTMDKQYQESFREFHKLAADVRQSRFVEMARANEAALMEVLTPARQVRLRQIALQAQGPLAFRDSSLAAALKLSPDQRKQMRAIENLSHDKRDFEFFDGFKKGPPPWKMLDEKRSAMMKQMLGVLTADQEKQWREMTGEPFVGQLPMLFAGPMPPQGFGPPTFGRGPKKDFRK
jgi:serine/threonine protein kinase